MASSPSASARGSRLPEEPRLRAAARRLRRAALVLRLRGIAAWDRLRLRALGWAHPGLEIDPTASSSLASARFELEPGARLRIGPGVAADRRRGALLFSVSAGADVEIGADTWLRTAVDPVHIVAFAGARISVGPGCLLNGCHVSAKREIRIGRHVWIGLGARVFDSDHHDLDADRPERAEPVELGDHVWLAADVSVLRGVRVGRHCVIGTRSVVTHDIPDHTLAFGSPARPQGVVGDRSKAR